MGRSNRRRDEYKFHILKKDVEYIAIYDADKVDPILDDLEEQGYTYLDWIRAKNSTVAVKRWHETKKEEIARLKQKNRELQETIEALEEEINQLERTSRKYSRNNRTKGLNDLSPYAIIGVPEGCSDLQLIKKNYKRLSLIFHADKATDVGQSDEMMKIINNAHELLRKKCA